MLAALVALVALSAYFSATETAFTSLNRIRLKTRADDGDKRAARTLALAADFDRLLSTLLIGNNIVNNVATTIGAVLFIQLIGSGKGPTVSATVLTIVILIFGEVTPKSLAKERPEAWAIVATPLLRVMAVVLTPVNFLFTQWKKLLRVLLRHQNDELKGSVLYTTETARISDLLRQLQQNKVHMAVVVDEYGGTQGIVTMEDIMEELVGEIWDEHDEVVEEFRKQSDGSYLVACSADLDDLYDLFDMKPGQEYDASSVSGWVMEEIGRVPDVGDRFQADGLDVCVTRVEHRRVMEIRVRPLPPEKEEPEKAHAHSGT